MTTRKKALLVIDFIHGIATDGSCKDYLSAHPSVISNVAQLIDAAREAKTPVIHIRIAYDKHYNGLPSFSPTKSYIKDNKKFLLDSHDTQFIPSIEIHPSDIIVNKKSGDPFCGNDLIAQLKEQDISELLFTGIATNNAILYGCNTAMQQGFHVTVIQDACGASTQEHHNLALELIKQHSAQEIIDTAKIFGQL